MEPRLRECRARKACVSTGGPAETANPLCAACMLHLQWCMEELPHLATGLKAFLAATPKTALHSRVRQTHGYSCPIDPRVDALMGAVTDAVDRVGGYKVRISDLITRPREKFTIWVGEHQQERWLDGCDLALEIGRLHKRINAILGFDRKWSKRYAPCPECAMPTLGHWSGESDIQCQNCEFRFTLEEYAIYCSELGEK